MNKQRNIKRRFKRTIMLNRNYPIGHATGLSEKEWEDFAKNYILYKAKPKENKNA